MVEGQRRKKGDMTFVYYIALSIIIKCASCLHEKFNQNWITYWKRLKLDLRQKKRIKNKIFFLDTGNMWHYECLCERK